jgi:hypothetical protein
MIRHSTRSQALKFRVATQSMMALSSVSGRRIPRPRHVALDEPEKIANWMATTVAAEGACTLYGHVSKALRVAVAARDAGLDLTGASFMAGGEPPTPTKVREIETGRRE